MHLWSSRYWIACDGGQIETDFSPATGTNAKMRFPSLPPHKHKRTFYYSCDMHVGSQVELASSFRRVYICLYVCMYGVGYIIVSDGRAEYSTLSLALCCKVPSGEWHPTRLELVFNL